MKSTNKITYWIPLGLVILSFLIGPYRESLYRTQFDLASKIGFFVLALILPILLIVFSFVRTTPKVLNNMKNISIAFASLQLLASIMFLIANLPRFYIMSMGRRIARQVIWGLLPKVPGYDLLVNFYFLFFTKVFPGMLVALSSICVVAANIVCIYLFSKMASIGPAMNRRSKKLSSYTTET